MSRSEIFVEDEDDANVRVVGSRTSLFSYGPETVVPSILTLSTIAGTAGDDFLIGTDAKDKLTGGGGDDQIFGKAGNDVLVGGPGDDILIGDVGNDTLRGGRGDDNLDGGPGLDYMIGHAGNDLYIVDNTEDIIIENSDGGHDTIGTYVSFTVPLWVEEIVALGDARVNLTGDRHGNFMIGNSNKNVIKGRGSADTVIGEGGNDVLVGNAGADILVGSSGNDRLRGNNGKDVLDGGFGHDVLRGGGGADILYGEAGNDTLYGNAGSDILLGGGGNNTLIGGRGSDRFVVESAGDKFDIVQDFSPGKAGDRIVIATDLLDVRSSTSNLEEYLRLVETSESTANIAIDVDGGGDSFIAVMQLNNMAGLPMSSLVVAEDGSLMITSTG